MTKQNNIINIIRYIVAIPVGIVASFFLTEILCCIWDYRDPSFAKWNHSIGRDIGYYVIFYYCVQWIVPYYKTLIPAIGICLLSIVKIGLISLLLIMGHIEGSDIFHLCLGVLEFYVGITLIRMDKGNYKKAT